MNAQTATVVTEETWTPEDLLMPEQWTSEALVTYGKAVLNQTKQHLEDEIQRVEEALAAEVELRRARREDDLRAIQKAEEAASVALKEAKDALNSRLDSMNEFRQQLNKQAAMFVTLDRHSAETDKLETLIERNRTDIIELGARTLPRETYETTLAQWAEWRAGVDAALSQHVGEQVGVDRTKSGAHANIGSTGVILGVVVAIIFIAMAMLNYSALRRTTNTPPAVTVTLPSP